MNDRRYSQNPVMARLVQATYCHTVPGQVARTSRAMTVGESQC
jgi:hypothetical protein